MLSGRDNISTTYAASDVYNIVIDHSSVSWAIDENISTWVDPSKPYTIHDITIQWNIISEGLYNSIHMDEGATMTDPHSMGAIFGQDAMKITVHHNIFAHNWGRNPPPPEYLELLILRFMDGVTRRLRLIKIKISPMF